MALPTFFGGRLQGQLLRGASAYRLGQAIGDRLFADNNSDVSEDPVAPVPDGFSSDSVTNSPTDYDFGEYLEGIFSSNGAENEVNRNYNSAEAKANREFQSAEALAQREWYEEMSNSAYRRAMTDMKAAGLNPILAYQQGGAAVSGTGVPSGSASSYQSGGGDSLSDIMNGLANLISAFSSASAAKSKLAASVLTSLL